MKTNDAFRIDFNAQSANPVPDTDFCNYLRARFDAQTTSRVLAVFDKLGLPPPESWREFIEGTQGALVFLNPYGLVFRIEQADPRQGGYPADRVNDLPWVIQPLASINAGQAVVEICPGCALQDDTMVSHWLADRLYKRGVHYWDKHWSNTGKLPATTPSFPKGIPVVIDRLAVRRLHQSTMETARLLPTVTREGHEARIAVTALYQPLRHAFESAWFDKVRAEGQKAFLDICRQYVAEGKLVAGWNDANGRDGKPVQARKSAVVYATRLGF